MKTLHVAAILGCLLGSGGCAPVPRVPALEERYYSFCCQTFETREGVAELMQARGFDCVGVGGSFGGTDISIRGTPEARLRARDGALKLMIERGWKLTWLADHIIVREPWDELGWEPGPWMRLATVEHRVTPTLEVLARLDREKILTHFEFGESSDLIFVKTRDLAHAAELVQRNALPGVFVLPPR